MNPIVADYCRRIRLIQLSPASELPTVTAHPHGMKGRESVSEGTGKYQTSIVCGGVVQLVRTPACHAGGRGFESRRSRQFPSLPWAGLSWRSPSSQHSGMSVDKQRMVESKAKVGPLLQARQSVAARAAETR